MRQYIPLKPLPPPIEKIETIKVLKQLSKAAKALGEWQGSSQIKPLSVERKAASRYLNQLEEIGVLSMKKLGRKKIYINNSLIEILKKY